MKRLALLTFLVACGSSSSGRGPSVIPTADPSPPAAVASTPSSPVAPAATPPVRVLADYPEPWDPSKPVERETLETKTMFVIAELSAVCPTRSEAEARACGNSGEDEHKGLRLRLGEIVTVVGDAPFDGHWRALRNQVTGTLPAWIRADDVADRPRMDALEAFERREDVGTAVPADGMTSKEIRALRPGTLVRWTRKRDIERGAYRRPSADDPYEGIVIFVPTKGGKAVAIEVREVKSPDDDHYLDLHPLAHESDGLLLNYGYGCPTDGHCDEVSILARTTKRRTPPPELDLESELDPPWPKRWHEPAPTLEAVVLADRFGLSEFAAPE
jgi:hypothetical protein